ncbi:hypothetical protein MF628_000928 [Paenibacillus polymyxa]|uniref:hypothetical protein n=1 Tax=Paenibacillus polymyxa TaxID=1406 RepID=UPI00202558B1|nr:hypothetical protein [Paenibacillus polymyxa]URJ46398.1 hypothetical protein MF628_000928 [Paenibacillus polymyxa]
MSRLKFEMWKHDPKYGGYMSRFTDGKGKWTDSWWSSPPPSIDHVGREYIPNRHPNVRTTQHDQYIKNRFKEEMAKLAGGEEQQ